MPKVTPFLWLNNQAEEAANFYCELFANSKINNFTRYTEVGKEIHQQCVGSVMTVDFEIDGQQFTALNGGSYFQITPGISFLVSCDSQQEVDRYYDVLADGGEEMQCGWVTDKFGVTWQIVPQVLIEMLADDDKAKAAAVNEAMMQMKKLDIKALQAAYDG